MKNLRFTSNGMLSGSAARTAEQEAKDAEDSGTPRPTPLRVQAGSAARDAEARNRADAEISGTVRTRPQGLFLRGQGGRVERLPTSGAAAPDVSPVSHQANTTAVPRQIMPGTVRPAPVSLSGEAAVPNRPSPGLLHHAAAQLQSRIRAFFKVGESS